MGLIYRCMSMNVVHVFHVICTKVICMLCVPYTCMYLVHEHVHVMYIHVCMNE